MGRPPCFFPDAFFRFRCEHGMKEAMWKGIERLRARESDGCATTGRIWAGRPAPISALARLGVHAHVAVFSLNLFCLFIVAAY